MGMCEGADKTVLLAGRSYEPSPRVYKNWLARVDSLGNILSLNEHTGTGNSTYAFFWQFKNVYGGAMALGTVSDSVSQNYDPFITKFDSSGNFLWSRRYLLPFNLQDATPVNIQCDSLGYVYLLLKAKQSWKTVLCKMDSTGTMIWMKSFQRSGLQAGNFIISSTNEIYLINNYYSTFKYGISYIKMDSSGQTIWNKFYSGNHVEELIELPGNRIAFKGFSFDVPEAVVGFSDTAGIMDCRSDTLEFNANYNNLMSSIAVVFTDQSQYSTAVFNFVLYPIVVVDSVLCGQPIVNTSQYPTKIPSGRSVYYENSNLHVSVLQPDIINLTIFDAMGRIIFSRNKLTLLQGDNIIFLPLQDYSSGIYLISVTGEVFQSYCHAFTE
jgi:hypothetical protein